MHEKNTVLPRNHAHLLVSLLVYLHVSTSKLFSGSGLNYAWKGYTKNCLNHLNSFYIGALEMLF